MARCNIVLVELSLRGAHVGPLLDIVYQAAAGAPGLANFLFSPGRRSLGSGIWPPLITRIIN
jgi:hypothetical protein